MSDNKKSMELTFKSQDTEEWIDIVFTRPIGYRWALFFNHFDIHPNVVTVISMFLGAAAGVMFVFDAGTTRGLIYNIIGVLLLAWANFYDSCDGQMARMTGKKTRLGRILDGFAGDVWFFCIYVAIVIRIFHQNIPFTDIHWEWFGLLLACICGFVCHARQCGLADYYRNVHLFFLKGKDGSELDNSVQQRKLYEETPWKGNFLWKIFLRSYCNYTRQQELQTPAFQALLAKIGKVYGDKIPQTFRDKFRKNSLPLMKYANILTFNVRAIVLYISCLANVPWMYLLFELVVMTTLYLYMRWRHESFCRRMLAEMEA
ncbi:MAG: CDP-alcohol phosphatidyltransferase family protein [Bacteroidaceae bacterium]|nr:CDP-alcohol phosphatidyltransferase family protein [Bacteroidaceae bacterium]